MSIPLSQAIRLGAMLTPQGKGLESANPSSDKTCAWGAAYQGAGLKCRYVPGASGTPLRDYQGQEPVRYLTVVIPIEWIVLTEQVKGCPECSKADKIARIMAHLNDDHDYSREQIADWIEVIEREQAECLEQAEARCGA